MYHYTTSTTFDTWLHLSHHLKEMNTFTFNSSSFKISKPKVHFKVHIKVPKFKFQVDEATCSEKMPTIQIVNFVILNFTKKLDQRFT